MCVCVSVRVCKRERGAERSWSSRQLLPPVVTQGGVKANGGQSIRFDSRPLGILWWKKNSSGSWVRITPLRFSSKNADENLFEYLWCQDLVILDYILTCLSVLVATQKCEALVGLGSNLTQILFCDNTVVRFFYHRSFCSSRSISFSSDLIISEDWLHLITCHLSFVSLISPLFLSLSSPHSAQRITHLTQFLPINVRQKENRLCSVFLLNSVDLRTRNSFESSLGLFVIVLNWVLLSCQLSSTAPFSLNLWAVVATQVVARPPSSLEVPSSNPGFVLHLFALLSHNYVKKFICSSNRVAPIPMNVLIL